MTDQDSIINGISPAVLEQLHKVFGASPSLVLAQSCCARTDPNELSLNRTVVNTHHHAFNVKISTEGKPVTNQRSSGRCWLFAALNVMRTPLMEKLELAELELSQNFVFFWDKFERCNYMLDAYITTARRGEPADGRLLAHLLHSPSDDGGQWDMIVNVVEKYGVVPRSCFPDTWSAENSYRMCRLINHKMREACAQLRSAVEDGKSEEKVAAVKSEYLKQVHHILCVCLGTPPSSMQWEYLDKNNKFHELGPCSPRDFYHQHIKPLCNLEDMVSFIHDPRPTSPYNKSYTVDFLGNMTGGRLTLHVNVEVDILKQLALSALQKNQPVWFGCDVGKHFNKKLGLLDLDIHQNELMFDCSLRKMSKAQRLTYGESLMTHAMMFSACGLDKDEKPTKWRVENSWGVDEGDAAKGYLLMTDAWFSEYVYQVVVDKSLVPAELLKAREEEPIVLPAWDPMGALA